MKVYVAGKWSNKEDIHYRILELRDRGLTIEHDWTQVEQTDRNPSAMAQYAKYDIDAVSGCDLLIALMDDPKYPYRGTFTEIGCALGLQKKIVIICPNYSKGSGIVPYCQTNVFFWHPGIDHVCDWDELLDYLRTQIHDYLTT